MVRSPIRRSQGDIRLLVSLLIAVVLLVSFTLWYTSRQGRTGDLRWCALVSSLDDRQQNLETVDPDAIRFRDQIHQLRRDLDCPPGLVLKAPQGSPSGE